MVNKLNLHCRITMEQVKTKRYICTMLSTPSPFVDVTKKMCFCTNTCRNPSLKISTKKNALHSQGDGGAESRAHISKWQFDWVR